MIGRSEDSHLRFSYDDPYISRKHCLLQCSPPRLRMIDLGSRNGVLVNGHRVLEGELKDSDVLSLGHTVIRVQVESGKAADMVTLDLPNLTSLDVTRSVAALCNQSAMSSSTSEPAVAADPTTTNLSIEGYQFGAELGRGGMGVVYRARRTKDGHEVAIKQLVGTGSTPPNAMQRFLREANILASLKHPNIVRLYEAGSTDSGGYIVMEFVNGFDMKAVITKGGPLHPTSATRLIRQVLAALAAAHSAGFVHRDVKPSNILLGQQADGRKVTKLADFGLARAYEASQVSGLTMQGEIGGTPLFMAPEQITHYRDVTPAADQYSAAATLYYLLTGRYPIEPEATASKTLVKILTEDPVPLQVRNPSLPPSLSAIVAKAMARDPSERYPSVLDFRDTLKPFTIVAAGHQSNLTKPE